MEFQQWLIDHEDKVRMSFFVGMIIFIGLWELLAPRRTLTVSKFIRWANNLGLVFFNSFVLRLVFPTLAVGMAAFATEQGWGIFNYFDWPMWLEFIAAIIILDLIIYLQHVMVHAVPAFWRLHRLHHADLDYDLTTGARFHPLEIILSMVIKFAAVLVLGPSVLAVIVFEIILNAMAMFNHGNIKLPLSLDKVLRLFVVTPDMHRVHHSVEDDEANSNFGFNLSLWDRIFGTYRDQPRGGHLDMQIGIRKFREQKDVSWLPGMLIMPFKGKISDYAINRRHWNDGEEQP